jgi:hypothetical protein
MRKKHYQYESRRNSKSEKLSAHLRSWNEVFTTIHTEVHSLHEHRDEGIQITNTSKEFAVLLFRDNKTLYRIYNVSIYRVLMAYRQFKIEAFQCLWSALFRQKVLAPSGRMSDKSPIKSYNFPLGFWRGRGASLRRAWYLSPPAR